jgi:hypothetical protein
MGWPSLRAIPVLAYAMSIGPLSLDMRRGVDWGWGYPARDD